MCTLFMCRIFPRSQISNSQKPLLFHFPSVSALWVCAILPGRFPRYLCVEAFQPTPLQHSFPALYRFSKLKASSKLMPRSSLFRWRAADLLLYRASCLSSLVILPRLLRHPPYGIVVGCVFYPRGSTGHETGYPHVCPPCKKRPADCIEEMFWFSREQALLLQRFCFSFRLLS